MTQPYFNEERINNLTTNYNWELVRLSNGGYHLRQKDKHYMKTVDFDLPDKVANKILSACVLHCPQCGEPVDQLHEGYCEECCNQNQAELDRFNAEYDHWNRMDDERREEAIRRGYT